MQMNLVHPAPSVSANVRRIVPGAVVHHTPLHELSAGVVRVLVVVEKVSDGEASDSDGVSVGGTRSGKLIRIRLDSLRLISEREIVRQIEPRNVRLRSCA